MRKHAHACAPLLAHHKTPFNLSDGEKQYTQSNAPRSRATTVFLLVSFSTARFFVFFFFYQRIQSKTVLENEIRSLARRSNYFHPFVFNLLLHSRILNEKCAILIETTAT